MYSTLDWESIYLIKICLVWVAASDRWLVGISIVLYTLKHIHTNLFYLLSALGLDFDFDLDVDFDVWEAVSCSKVDDGLKWVVDDGLSRTELGELIIEWQFTFN